MFYHSRSDLLSDARAFDACLAAQNRSNGALRSFAEDVRLLSLQARLRAEDFGSIELHFLIRVS